MMNICSNRKDYTSINWCSREEAADNTMTTVAAEKKNNASTALDSISFHGC